MKYFFALFAVVVLALFASSFSHDTNTHTNIATPPEQLRSDVVSEWIDVFLKLTTETSGFTPPVAARAFGYTGLALYEAVRFGVPNAQTLTGQITEFETTYMEGVYPPENPEWEVIANATLASMARTMYPNASIENIALIDTLETRLFEKYAHNETAIDSAHFGTTVAERISSYAHSDGQSEAYKMNFPEEFLPPQGDGLWEPTPDIMTGALQPYWGNTRAFIQTNVTETLPPAPPEYSLEEDSQFYTEMMEVYTTVENLKPEERIIAEFWSDDPGTTATPPGHSLSILNHVIKKENLSLIDSSVAFARLGMSLHDAFVACWYAKYEYNLVRPLTVIQEHIDSDFSIPLKTPPFPEYPSGHSVQSGAAAEVFEALWGTSYSFTDSTHVHRTDIDGSVRMFSSFAEFADEAAISRLYGGIHFRSAIELGVAQGREIGKNINKLILVSK